MTATESTGPLSGEQISQLQQARERTEPIRRASRYAGYFGRMLLLAAAFIALFSFTNQDTPGLALAGVFAILGFHQIKSAKPMRQLSDSAFTAVAFNHAATAAAIVGYCGYYMFFDAGHSALVQNAQASVMASVPESFQSQQANLGYYVLSAFAVLGGGFGFYYTSSKKKPLGSFATECPPWIVGLYRSGAVS